MRTGPSTPEYGGKFTFLDLLAVLLLKQLWRPSFLRAYCHFRFSLAVLAGPILQSGFPADQLKCVLVHGVSLQIWDSAFPFVNLHEVPVISFLQLVEAFLNDSTTILSVSCSSQLVSSVNLLRVHPIRSARSLVMMLCSTGFSIDPCGIPLVTDYRVDFMLLITAF